MQAAQLNGVDIIIDLEGNEVIAAVEVYPQRREVRVKRDEDQNVLWEKIKEAIAEMMI